MKYALILFSALFLAENAAFAKQVCARTDMLLDWTLSFDSIEDRLRENLGEKYFHAPVGKIQFRYPNTFELDRSIKVGFVAEVNGRIVDMQKDVRLEYFLHAPKLSNKGYRLEYSIFINRENPGLKKLGLNAFYVSELLKRHEVSEMETMLVSESLSIFYKDFYNEENRMMGYERLLKELENIPSLEQKQTLRNKILDSLLNGTNVGRTANRFGFIYVSEIEINAGSLRYVVTRTTDTNAPSTKIQIQDRDGKITEL